MVRLFHAIANHYALQRLCVYLSSVTPARAAIFVYHQVCDQGTRRSLPAGAALEFEKQIKYLNKACKVMPLDELTEHVLAGKTLPKRAAAITFDDGYRDNYQYAYPVLKRYGLPATFFLATDYIDNRKLFWWDQLSYILHKTHLQVIEVGGLGNYYLRSDTERLQAALNITRRLKKLPDKRKNLLLESLADISAVEIPAGLGNEIILSWHEIREMSANGMDFGAHTLSHPILTRVPLKAAIKEITESKRHIEEKIRKRVTTFAYPNGTPSDHNDDITEILKESGFTFAFTSAPPGMASPEADRYHISRIPCVTEGLYLITTFFSGLAPIFFYLQKRIRKGG